MVAEDWCDVVGGDQAKVFELLEEQVQFQKQGGVDVF